MSACLHTTTLAAGCMLATLALSQSTTTTAIRLTHPLLREIRQSGFEIPLVPITWQAGRPCDARYSIAIGDIDGNGAPDVVYGSIGGFRPRLLLNDGYGRLTEVTATHMPNEFPTTYQIALGVLDGDGDLDYVSANIEGPNYDAASILINDGSGHFTLETAQRGLAWPTFQEPNQSSVALGDFDLDGDVDIVLGGSSGLALHPYSGYLIRNNGQGHFTYDQSAFPLDHALRDPGPLPGFIACDTDGDGDMDLLASSYHGGIAYWINDGTGHFADAMLTRIHPAPNTFVSLGVNIGDLDGDGDIDLVVSRGYTRAPPIIYLNDGSGSFYESSAGRIPAQCQAGLQPGVIDIDGDGDLDIVNFRPPLAPNFAGDIQVLVNDGTGHFSLDPSDSFLDREQANGGVEYVVAKDMDGDQDQDLLVAETCAIPAPPGRQRYFLNTTRHTFAEERPARGHTWRVEVNGIAGGFGVLAVALTRADTPIPPFGRLALDPQTTLVWPRVLTFDADRTAVTDLPIPDLPVLAGHPLYVQALCVEPSRRARFSNLWIEDAIR